MDLFLKSSIQDSFLLFPMLHLCIFRNLQFRVAQSLARDMGLGGDGCSFRMDRPFGSDVPVGVKNDAPSIRAGLSPAPACKSKPVSKKLDKFSIYTVSNRKKTFRLYGLVIE